MTEDMRRCLKRERDRERRWRTTPQGAFESSMLSLDQGARVGESNISNEWMSDKGLGVERLVDAIDGVGDLSWYNRRIRAARERLKRAHPELLKVFDLIIKNGNNRKESICQLMKSTLRKRHNGMPQVSVIGHT